MIKTRKTENPIINCIDRMLGWKGTPYLAILIILIFILFPFYWMFLSSFKSMQEIFRWPPTLIPESFTLAPYKNALFKSPTPLLIMNSFIYSGAVSLVVTFLATITTYALALYRYKGSDQVFLLFFITRVIPPQSLWLPFVIFFTKLGLLNTRPAVIIYSIVLVYPLSIWMLKGLFDNFPREIVDSSLIDGSSNFGSLFRVVIPIIAPGVSAVSIVAFLWTWADFMFPYLIINNPSLYPITVGIYYFIGDEGVIWNSLAAAEVMAMLPGIIFFTIAQKHIVKGLSAGAIK
jgi:multiple sugar transport system permease protein